tara:strand:- start:1640 stop:1912 length:273 start_codon:yes stop_codon:yes gene_type:complete
MSTNITTKFFSGATNGVIVTTSDFTRVVAIHAYSTVAGTLALSDSSGDKIKFEVPASSMSDIYIGEMGVRFNGTVSCSSPGTGGITLFLG